MGPSLELYRCSHGQLFPTSLFSLSFLRGSVSQILTLLLSKIQMRIFSIFHTRGLSNIRKDATNNIGFLEVFLVFLELYETHCIGYTCVTPQNTVAVSELLIAVSKLFSWICRQDFMRLFHRRT